jgi:hypothetical protein
MLNVVVFFCLLIIGNDGDGADSDSEKGNHYTSRKPLMRTLTNADNKLTNEQDQSQRMSNWRHSKTNLNRMRSLDLLEIGQGDNIAYTNAAHSAHHRSRTQNAFNKFVHQSIDFARRRILILISFDNTLFVSLDYRRSRNK